MTAYATEVATPHCVEQTILYSEEANARGIYGNCFQAALASVLGLPLDAVPHVLTFADWIAALDLFLEGIGLTRRDEKTTAFPESPHAPCLVTGLSPRGVLHTVAAFGNGDVWDPHPSHDGLVDVREVMWLEPQSSTAGVPGLALPKEGRAG